MSKTWVYKLSTGEAADLREKLNQGNFEFRKLNHAQFQVRADGLTASMYNSGKLVVQGKNAEAWCVQYVGDKPASETKPVPIEITPGNWPPSVDAIGSDEAGKGDSFGGLVVSAVGLTSETLDLVKQTTICDSKQMNDSLILQLAPWLKEHVSYKTVNLFPADYNAQWASHGDNVNNLLTDMHVDCIKGVAEQGQYKNIVVDRFSPRLPVSKNLATSLPDIAVTEKPRAEEFLAVACASVLARAGFLEQIETLSEQLGLDVPLGSGRPVPPALHRYRDIHGNGKWQQAVKMHFKNIQKFIF
ncbi:MAG TPA: ribonuclease HIII [Planctomycetes bacterium]|jgi:ribonuclease HIII|nr:ribonuclease HIII [Planctomycetota bacterium]